MRVYVLLTYYIVNSFILFGWDIKHSLDGVHHDTG